MKDLAPTMPTQPLASDIQDPRDPRSGPVAHPMFVNHNCWKCREGERPCVAGSPSRCEYPHARND